MADEQLSIRLEALAESVRTSMTVSEAEESFTELTELVVSCSQEQGRVHELAGQVFRALLPAFVMTDAEFKTPGSLNQPTKAMHAVKQASVSWLLALTSLVPTLLVPEPTSRGGYSRRMHMAAEDEENTPPIEENGGDTFFLDPVVALMQRLAVRCPDKADWRRAVIADVVAPLAKTSCKDRYISFLEKIVVSEKAAWRIWALEAMAVIGTSFEVALKRTRDAVPGVRCAAMKAAALCDDNERVCAMFVFQSRDEKPSVRRAAVSVFDQIVPVVGLRPDLVQVLATLAMDESLMVRKACVGSIASMDPSAPLWAGLWCSSVLPLVTDVEATVVEKVVESVEYRLLGPIGQVGKKIDLLPAPLAALLEAMNQSWESCEYAKRALRLVVLKGDSKFSRQILTGIERILTAKATTATTPLWALLDELAASGLTLAPGAMSELFALYFGPTDLINNAALCRIMRQSLKKGTKFDSIQTKLENFVADEKNEISLLHEVFALLNAMDEKSIFPTLLKSSEACLEQIVLAAVPASCEWYIAIMGELAALGYLPTARGLTALEATATNRVYTEGTVHCVLPPAVRAAAMVAFGKICLEKESIAKRAVSKFAAHLSREEHPIVRNNVLIMLGDLCVLYTGLVDQYLPWVTNCLSDPNDLIRYQAAVVVASLLAEDYIKFKGQIVFRLLYLLSDSNVKIKYFTESVFARILFLRHSASLKTLFAETVCALNGYMRHPQFQGAMGNRDFCLVANPGRRREIYAFMLRNVATTEQKFNSIVQLANSLLAAFVDEDVTNGQVQIPARETDPGGQVMIDTLFLLSCKELKLATRAVDALPDDAVEPDHEKKQFDAALQKKTIVDNLVPLLIQLNRLCESKRSPISRYVRDCLRELMKDYREEVSLILHADSQLAEELKWDLQEHDERPEQAEQPELAEQPEQVAQPEQNETVGKISLADSPVARPKRIKLEAAVKQEEDVAAPRASLRLRGKP